MNPAEACMACVRHQSAPAVITELAVAGSDELHHNLVWAFVHHGSSSKSKQCSWLDPYATEVYSERLLEELVGRAALLEES
jgi:hypothetical protein